MPARSIHPRSMPQPRPRPPAVPSRPRGWVRSAWLLALALVIGVSPILSTGVRASGTWTKNLWAERSFLYQDPYGTACTAASTMLMLNLTARRGSGGPGFRWTPYLVKHNARVRTDYRDMTSILYFARARDTLRASSAGSDAHGWRNALNYHGWGDTVMRDPGRRVYEDLTFGSFDETVRAAVRAIARFDMPVGILAWAGGHAQVMTGYEVVGEDPALSDDFTVTAVWISDPLKRQRLVNARVTLDELRSGDPRVRLRRYREFDSPFDDPFTPGWRRSSVRPSVGPSEWYNRFVLVAPVRGFVPLPTPTPVPTPEPTPTPEPSAPQTPEPSAPERPEPTPEPSAEPTPEPSAEPTPEP